jgi:hypothetical protein
MSLRTPIKGGIDHMLKRIGAIVTAGGAAAALTVALGTAPTFAATPKATTWSITPGGNVTGAATNPTLKDTKSGTVLTCTTSTTAAKLKSGAHQTNPLGSITSIAFQNCTGPLGLTFTVTIKDLPYKLDGTAATTSGGVTKGKITGIMASIAGSGCSANVAGTTATAKGQVTGTFTNSSSTLKVSGGNLHIWGVNGCFGLIANGDPSTFSASYKISPAQTITSP